MTRINTDKSRRRRIQTEAKIVFAFADLPTDSSTTPDLGTCHVQLVNPYHCSNKLLTVGQRARCLVQVRAVVISHFPRALAEYQYR